MQAPRVNDSGRRRRVQAGRSWAGTAAGLRPAQAGAGLKGWRAVTGEKKREQLRT
jgi:hypothetical protein